MRNAGLAGLILVANCGIVLAGEPTIKISAPRNDLVEDRALVRGTTSLAEGTVAILVSPVRIGGYRVQEVVPAARGKFNGIAQFGEPKKDYREKFELLVVLNPKSKLEKGQALEQAPEGDAADTVIVEKGLRK